jgi:hypothetical protein
VAETPAPAVGWAVVGVWVGTGAVVGLGVDAIGVVEAVVGVWVGTRALVGLGVDATGVVEGGLVVGVGLGKTVDVTATVGNEVVGVGVGAATVVIGSSAQQRKNCVSAADAHVFCST